jgi:3-isopropylmalate/(R)-2-methylmalate dehydratase small subunit
MVDKILKGRIWVIARNGKLVNDIDTDMIFHNAHLAITDIKLMGQHAFGNLEGFKNFSKEAKPGDLVITGGNFGAGSSRQQAVDCFKSLGISCLVCKSYGAIYKRNAINSGFPILTIKGLNVEDPAGANFIKHLDIIEVDLVKSEVRHDGKVVGTIEPFSKVQMDIYEAGNIFKYGKTIKS